MTEYMVKVRVDDFDDNGKDCIKEMFDQFINEMLGNAPFDMEIDSIENAKPKAVDDILAKGICPHCKIESLYEDERSEEHITFLCDNCNRETHVERDDMGIRSVAMLWCDKNKPIFDDRMEEIIYERE